MTARLPTLLILAALATLPLAGCFAGTVQRTDFRSQELDADHDGRQDWLRITLLGGDHGPVASDDLDVLVRGGFGEAHRTPCWQPRLFHSQCEDAFGPDETWALGTSLYLPCRERGELDVELRFAWGGVLEGELRCEEAA